MSVTFSKGVLMSEDKGLTSENDGVYFEFMPDREILNDYVFRMDILTDIVNEICCTHIESSEEYVRSYVNEHRTKAGGTHEEAFRKGLAYALSKSLKEKITPENAVEAFSR